MMPISNELKQAGQHVYQAYNERLREEREQLEETKRKGEERSKKARRGKKTIGGSREEFKRQKREII